MKIPCITLGYLVGFVIVIIIAVMLLTALLPSGIAPVISTLGSVSLAVLILWYIASWIVECDTTRRISVTQD